MEGRLYLRAVQVVLTLLVGRSDHTIEAGVLQFISSRNDVLLVKPIRRIYISLHVGPACVVTSTRRAGCSSLAGKGAKLPMGQTYVLGPAALSHRHMSLAKYEIPNAHGSHDLCSLRPGQKSGKV